MIDVAAWQQPQLAQPQLAQPQLAQPQLAQPPYPLAPHPQAQPQHAYHPQQLGHAAATPPGLHASPGAHVPPMQHPQAPYVPPVRAATHNVRRYDMTADATHDAMVRRIIWIALFVCGLIALAIASR
jgi:hypothetical protein